MCVPRRDSRALAVLAVSCLSPGCWRRAEVETCRGAYCEPCWRSICELEELAASAPAPASRRRARLREAATWLMASIVLGVLAYMGVLAGEAVLEWLL